MVAHMHRDEPEDDTPQESVPAASSRASRQPRSRWARALLRSMSRCGWPLAALTANAVLGQVTVDIQIYLR